jgi:hypothetical protein
MRALPMEWNWLPGGRGFTAAGRDNTYLIAADRSAGLVTGIRLTRWRSLPLAPAAYATALEVAVNTIVLALPAPRPFADPEVGGLMETARRLAVEYESGRTLPGHPAWHS